MPFLACDLAYLVVIGLGQNRVLEKVVGGEGEEQLEAGLLGVQVLELDVGQVLESLYMYALASRGSA